MLGILPRSDRPIDQSTKNTLWLFNIAMEAMAHRNKWFTYYKW